MLPDMIDMAAAIIRSGANLETDKLSESFAPILTSRLDETEVARIRQEAIQETEEKYKRKVQETFQCTVCLHVPKEGHIVQCQNGHLLCGECADRNEGSNRCPNCRAPMDKLSGNKRIRALSAEQLIEAVDLKFQCKHPFCEGIASRREMIAHEKKCSYRMVPCPDGNCKETLQFYILLDHMKLWRQEPWINATRMPQGQRYLVNEADLHNDQDLNWNCVVFDYQNSHFGMVTCKVRGTFYSYVHIFDDGEEAKKFKVAISVGKGGQTGLFHTGQVFPIDAKREDIIKEKSGVLSFSPTGMGELFFEDIPIASSKALSVYVNIMKEEENKWMTFSMCEGKVL